MEVAQFAAAAKAAAPFIADPALKPGQRIRAAVGASMDAADCNTNLGIILLCGPLAAAAQMRRDGESLRQRLAEVLDDAGTVILAPTGPNAGIVMDSYGHPAGRGPEFLELPLFDEAGGLSEDLRLITLEDEPD